MVRQIKINLKATRDMQKSYVEKKQTSKQYKVRDHLFFRVKSKKRKLRASLYTKLAPRYVGPFEILSRIEHVAY